MKIKYNLLILILLNFNLLAIETVKCPISDENAPAWICTQNKPLEAIGSGNSKIEAIATALCNHSLSINSKVSSKTFDYKSTNKAVKQVSTMQYGKDISVESEIKKFTNTDTEEQFYTSSCKLSIKTTSDALFSINISQQKKINTEKESFKEHVEIDNNTNLKIQNILKDSGIVILKNYSSSQFKEYILLKVDKNPL